MSSTVREQLTKGHKMKNLLKARQEKNIKDWWELSAKMDKYLAASKKRNLAKLKD